MTKLACVLAAAALALAPQDERIERAVAWLADADPELRAMGARQVAGFGRDALPALEKSLEKARLLEVAKAWRAADAAAAAPRWVAEADLDVLPEDDPGAKEVAKLDRAAVEKYVRAKYQEAMGWVRKKNYARAHEVAAALLALEPKSAHADSIRKLKRHADAMVLQTTLLEAKLLHAKPAYAAGEAVELRLRMKNIHSFPLSVSYGKTDGPAAAAPPGVVIVEIETKIVSLAGNTESWTRSQEVRVENEIPIAPGAQWEVAFSADLGVDADDRENAREITVSAWTAPSRIEVQGRDATRRIQFEPATFKVVPARYAAYLASPLESLGKTIDGASAQETFVCSRLLEGADRDPGAAMLIQAMAKTENPGYREALSWVLLHLTGERLGADPKKWQEWMEKKSSK